MKHSGHLSGGAALMKGYQVDATVANIGQPLNAAATADAGLAIPASGTDVDNMVGLALDVATYVTAQQTDGTSPERKVRVNIRPDAILHARISGGATEGTALTLHDVTAAAADGLTITSGGDFTSPDLDDGAMWGYDGSNAGQIRKVTAAAATVATVTVAFDNDTVVGDNYIGVPWFPMEETTDTVNLTAAFLEVDASVSAATGAALYLIEILHLDISRAGTLNSSVLMLPAEHFLNPRS